MTPQKLRELFINFFVQKGHKQIPSSSLVPENDPTVLFTTAGMHPLVPYLMGQPNPLGKRLCSIQKCLRTDDIEEIGDMRHFSFFEMLGNWSLGDYFKKEAIEWSLEFLTEKQWLGLDPAKIYISVFEGDQDAPKDTDSIKFWQESFAKRGIKALEGERIFCYGKDKNWWGPAGQTGPCGPDTEMFYDTGLLHDEKYGEFCHPNCDCGRFVEMWNDVFMEFNKKADGTFEPLKQKNVDTGMGLERTVAIMEFLEGKIKKPDPFATELFSSMIRMIELKSDKRYKEYLKEFRIILDHIRASVFLVADGVEPSKGDRGYVLRRLITRSIENLNKINVNHSIISSFAEPIINIYKKDYPDLEKKKEKIVNIFSQEEQRFYKIKNVFMPKLEKVAEEISSSSVDEILDKYLLSKKGLGDVKSFLNEYPITTISGASGTIAFDFKTTHGFPVDESRNIFKKNINNFNEVEFGMAYSNINMYLHQSISRKSIGSKFKGGLQDHSEQTTKLHTATHLLHTALRQILGNHVQQVGSNITAKRLRFDFIHPQKLTDEEIIKVEKLVNEHIKENLTVKMEIMTLEEARKKGALAFFGQKYPEKVKVYSIGDFSQEVCGGPHVDFTAALGTLKIIKEEAIGQGKRRIYAVLQ